MTGIFKVSDFPVPAFGQEGNLGRGTYRGPGYANTDLSMIKNFKTAVVSRRTVPTCVSAPKRSTCSTGSTWLIPIQR